MTNQLAFSGLGPYLILNGDFQWVCSSVCQHYRKLCSYMVSAFDPLLSTTASMDGKCSVFWFFTVLFSGLSVRRVGDSVGCLAGIWTQNGWYRRDECGETTLGSKEIQDGKERCHYKEDPETGGVGRGKWEEEGHSLVADWTGTFIQRISSGM